MSQVKRTTEDAGTQIEENIEEVEEKEEKDLEDLLSSFGVDESKIGISHYLKWKKFRHANPLII